MTAKQQKKTATKRPPEPRWPYSACPKGALSTAADVLNAIVVTAARRRAKNLDRISMLVIDCTAVWSGTANQKLCEKLVAAKDYADGGAWSKVTDILETLAKGKS